MGIVIDFSVLKLPPSINSYYKAKRGGGRYVCAEGVAFKELVMSHICFKPLGGAMRGVKYKLEIELFSPNWITKKGAIRKVDIDNVGAKCAIDAISAAMDFDDSQIFHLTLTKKEDKFDSTRFILTELID